MNQDRTWAEILLLHSGIVQGKAEISHINRKSDFSSLKVKFPDGRLNGAQIGASVAINGTCLTVSLFDFSQYICLPVGSGSCHFYRALFKHMHTDDRCAKSCSGICLLAELRILMEYRETCVIPTSYVRGRPAPNHRLCG